MAITLNGTTGISSPGGDTSTSLATTNLSYTGTLTGGTGVIAIGTNQIYKDSSGNIGLGVTPSAGWGSTYKAIQIGTSGSISAVNNASPGLMQISNNSCSGVSAETYLHTGTASMFRVGSAGAFTWYQAASGTAGSAIAYSSTMTLNASGNLHVPGGGGIASNEAFGSGALKSNTTGYNNTASGVNALFSNTTGDSNTASGIGALQLNTTGAANTASGGLALYSNTTGYNNTASGYQALYSNTTGYNNTASGFQALFLNTTGFQNTASGLNALYYNTTGSQNTAFGYTAHQNNTTGQYNCVFGAGALVTGTTGTGNCSFGYNGMAASAVTGSYNAGYGYNALYNLTTGSGNVGLGQGAGNGITTGSYNIYIGYGAIPSAAANGSELVIGSSPNTTGKGSGTGYINVGGSIYQGNNSGSWATTSDQRIKENIKPIAEGLSVINALNPVNFDYKESGKNEDGFIAQDYQTVLPQQIVTHAPSEAEKEWVDEEVLGIQQNLIPFLVKAIQELTTRLEALEAKA